MRVLRFLLILSFDLRFSNRFYVTSDCYGEKEIEYTVYASDSKRGLAERDCLLVWKLVEYTFNHLTYLSKDVRCERSKQSRLCLRQADSASRLYEKEFTFDKSSSIK